MIHRISESKIRVIGEVIRGVQLRQPERAHERQCGLWRSGFGKGSTSFDWRYQLDIWIESQRPEIAAAAHLYYVVSLLKETGI
jgi:hypothetical protein